jgi:hypothetical protein
MKESVSRRAKSQVAFDRRGLKNKQDAIDTRKRDELLIWLQETFCVEIFPDGRAEAASWPLMLLSVKPSTAVAYGKAVEKFHGYLSCIDQQAPGSGQTKNNDELDLAACAYGAYLLELPQPPSSSSYGHLFSGLTKFFPSHTFKRLGVAIQAYSKQVPTNKGLPMPAWIVGYLMGYFIHLQTERGLMCAALTWTLFDTLARINELIEALGEHLQEVSAACKGTTTVGVLAFPEETKHGYKESVNITDPHLWKVLNAIKQRNAQEKAETLFGISYDVYANELRDALAALGLGEGYTPHSLRHGGATHLKLCGWTVEDIKMRGRWESKAFKIYLSETEVCGMQHLAKLRISMGSASDEYMRKGVEFYENRHLLFKSVLRLTFENVLKQ